MIKGIYTTEASMRPKMSRLDVLANNLANINSTGFKRDRVFVQVLENAVANPAGGGDLEGVNVRRAIDFTEGSLAQTGNPLDLALQGKGFFVVDTSAGARLTRDGSFRVTEEGVLTTGDALPVQGVNGPIQFPQAQRLDQSTITVSAGGEVAVGKDVIGHLRIVTVEDTSRLTKEKQSLFVPAAGQRVEEGIPEGTVVRQGYLEESNVEGIAEMVEMIELNRAFETDQKSIQALDQTLERSLDVGRV
jgi:flagellar basal-body rod protein FlgG